MSKRYFSQHKWNKDSLLNFLSFHLIENVDYKILLIDNNEVYINVLTYKASHALFGKNGMNKPLCWATHPYMWGYSLQIKSYINRKHIFYFNFNLDKDDELAKLSFAYGLIKPYLKTWIVCVTSNHNEIWCDLEWIEKMPLLNQLFNKAEEPNDKNDYPKIKREIIFNIENTIDKEHMYGKKITN